VDPVALTVTRRAVRAVGVAVLIGLAAAWVAWLGFRPQVMGDYTNDYAPAMNALLAGHVGAFFAHLPTNGAGGSLLIRAPGALLGKLLVGSQLAIFRFGALFCELIVAAVALMLTREMRAAGRTLAAQTTLVALFVLTPAVLDAIMFGHPEEGMGAALCIAAVLLAGRGRAGLAGVVLGLAIINKPWGVLAVFPVLLATPELRIKTVVHTSAAALAIAVPWIVGAYVASPAHFSRTVFGASSSIVAHPVSLWWPLAHLHVAPGIEPAYFPPHFVSAHARTLAVLLALPLATALVLRPDRRSVQTSLALLALLFLLRCLLDPSNHVYYQVPFVLAAAAWESLRRGAPVIALISLAGFVAVFHTLAGTGSLTLQFAGYLAVALPLVALFGGVVFGRRLGIVQPHDRHRVSRGVSRGLAS
jgi:Glycosyltransferase family 87